MKTSHIGSPSRRAVALYAVLATAPSYFIGGYVATALGVPLWLRPPFTLACAIGGTLLFYRGVLALADGSGAFFARFVAPTGASTPYEPTFSYQQALAVRGDVTGALASFERVLERAPHDVEAHRQAAELYARCGNATRAAELFQRMRRIHGLGAASELYATSRLVDLYCGPLGDEGRALVELRRIAERFPETDAAAGARRAIGEMKGAR